ncbi:MAG: heparan-alpha-glucosaminide N-acetyltransferase domain-containing protein [Chitinophagaceae bacterium]|nr:heparan-alpha-glucosaminide N-acetyltransferase domain-containing protein [Chitinophagaceae bacterium]
MPAPLTLNQKRIESIDIIRGIAMVIMALDHTRDYFHIGANLDDPLNLATTTPALYFTRWITHFCAPIFVFLSGTSIYLQSLRKTKKELGIFLLKRGLWLIIAEWTIVAFAWTFNPFFNVIPFQVIWAIGISMVILGLIVLMKLNYKIIFILGVVLVAGHNLLDIPEAAPGFTANFWWDIFHHGFFTQYEFAPRHYAILVYPFPAWTGVMLLGYCAGVLFTQKYSSERRKKILTRIGLGLILFFVALRFSNLYGDPRDWSTQKNSLYTFLSFMKVNKYPPSLLYLCITIGPALLLLAFMEKIKNRFTGWMVVYGRTAFFYYIIHLYLIHLVAAVCFFARGHSMADAMNSANIYPFLFVAPGEGYGLLIVYLVWAAVIISLYPLCKWYDKYKTNHKEKWWLSYL